MSNKFVDEVRSGPRLYDILTEDGNTTLYSKVQINKNYIPLVEGSKFGAKDANRIDNVNSLQSLEIVDMRLDMTLFKLGYVGFYDMFDTLDDVDGTKTNADVNTTNQDVTFDVNTYDITASADYTAVSTIRTNEEPAVGDRVDNTNEILTVTPISDEVVYDRTTPVQLINDDDTTYAHARPYVLSNGEIVTLTKDNTNDRLRFTKYSADGDVITNLGYRAGSGVTDATFTILNDDKVVFTRQTSATSDMNVTTFLLSEANGNDVSTTASYATQVLDSANASGAWGGCEFVKGSETNIHVVLSSVVSALPNSKNVRYRKTTDGADNWDTPTQISTINTASSDMYEPTIIIKNDGNPYIVNVYKHPTLFYNIVYFDYNGTSWTSYNGTQVIYTSGSLSYIQSSPTADTSSDGKIAVAWHGRDVTDPSQYNILFSQSTDEGLNWSGAEKITTGNVYGQLFATITRNDNDEIFIVWVGKDPAVSATYSNTRLVKGSSNSWGAIETITDRTVFSNSHPSSCNNYRNFEKPLAIWEDNQDADVKFYGKWTEGGTVYELGLQSIVTVVEDEVLTVYPSAYPFETLTMKEQSFIIQAESVLTKLYLKSGTSADFEVYINDVLATLIEDDGLELTYESISVDSPDIVLKVNGKDSAVLDNALFAVA